MAKMVRWACPECDEETHFKGLCRKCTEYDDAGHPVKPVHRIRLNHTPTQHTPHIRTKNDFVDGRRKKPSKKQLEAIKEKLNAGSRPVSHQHEHGEDCGDDCGHAGDFVEIGESIGGEEE